MDLAAVFREGDWVLIGVFLTLLTMSMLTWYLILAKSAWTRRVRRANRSFQQVFWDAENIVAARQYAKSAESSPLGRLAHSVFAALEHAQQRAPAGFTEASAVDEFLVRTLRNGINRETAKTASGMTLLASIGSTAPFIGLFGTVWGIYHALIAISLAGSASMEMVAGPLGEALVATAAGLAAAIPAVLAFNAFSRVNRTLAEELDGFAYDLHAFLTNNARSIASGTEKTQEAG